MIILLIVVIKEMGKFTKDKRVTKNNQYSNHVHLSSHSNLGYLLSQSQGGVLPREIRLQTAANR
jgi:hypothetical protein